MAGYKRRRRFRRGGRRRLRRRIGRRYRRYGRSRGATRKHEIKFFDNTLQGTYSQIPSAFIEVPFPSMVAQGVDRNQRIGRQIVIKSLYINMWIQGAWNLQPGVDRPFSFLRFVVASFDGAAGPTPLGSVGHQLASIIKPTTTTSLRKKFYDRTICMQRPSCYTDAAADVGALQSFKHIKIFLRFRKGYTIRWNGAGATDYKRFIDFGICNDVSSAPYPGCFMGYYSLKYFDI